MIPRYSLPKMKAIWEEQNKYQKWLDVEIAVCEAAAGLGYIPSEAAKEIKEKAKFNLAQIERVEKEVQHDVIAFLTNVSSFVGSSSKYIHFGMTSSDVVDSALALQMKEAADILIADVNDLLESIKTKALEHKETLMIGRTHGIHAEPITFGIKLAVWFFELMRNLDRLKKAQETISYGKISGAVGTYANIDPRIEELVCRKLGLNNAEASTQVLQRDRHAEYMSVLAIIGSSLDKFATEIRGLQRTDILEAEEPFAKGQKGSSAMPHKRNPIVCERISGMARVLRSNAQAAFENVALWHERDISHSSVERIIVPDSTILLDYMLNKFTNIIKNLLVYPENMIRNLEKTRGLIFSQKVLLGLVEAGCLREEAYSLVQQNAMRVWEGKGDFKSLLSSDEEVIRYISKQEIESCFDYKYYLRNVNQIFDKLKETEV
ncbi:MAG: adenylosuccinate lyase [Actinobacteria bacterium]|nr:adenylosuccinate lyase [Actinomycetota bacterium]